MTKQPINEIKQVCNKYNITQAYLAIQIGYTAQSLRNLANKEVLPRPLKCTLRLFDENQEHKKRYEKIAQLKTLLTQILN